MHAYLRLIRPADWIKNCFVFAALVFGNQLSNTHALLLSVAAFFAFSFTASAGYVFNDILDRERDRHHPRKCRRPIASGEVTPQTASVLVVVLLAIAATLVFTVLPRSFGAVLLGYLVLTLTYSIVLKHQMILDVIVIAVLFVLRAVGGAVAIQVEVSPWLLVCTFMLCMFLGFGKRRCEIAAIANAEGEAKSHRPLLDRYTPDLLNHLLSTSGGIAIVTFLLYTLDTSTPSSMSPVHKHRLMYTLPLVVYGIYRYAMIIESGKATGPTELIIKDAPFLATVILWALIAMAMLYWRIGPV